jgi:hypothetical protein
MYTCHLHLEFVNRIISHLLGSSGINYMFQRPFFLPKFWIFVISLINVFTILPLAPWLGFSQFQFPCPLSCVLVCLVYLFLCVTYEVEHSWERLSMGRHCNVQTRRHLSSWASTHVKFLSKSCLNPATIISYKLACSHGNNGASVITKRLIWWKTLLLSRQLYVP